LGSEIRLRVGDLDNNGGLDLLLASASKPGKTIGGLVWLSDEKGNLKLLDQSLGFGEIFDAVDLNGDGRLDLIGIDAKPQQAINHGSKNYHWQVVRPHASQASGDQRINPFGV